MYKEKIQNFNIVDALNKIPKLILSYSDNTLWPLSNKVLFNKTNNCRVKCLKYEKKFILFQQNRD